MKWVRLPRLTLQIVRALVMRFNEGAPDGLATRKAQGRVAILNYERRAQLAAMVEARAIPAAYGVVSYGHKGSSAPPPPIASNAARWQARALGIV